MPAIIWSDTRNGKKKSENTYIFAYENGYK